MSLTITITGTTDDIIDFGKKLARIKRLDEKKIPSLDKQIIAIMASSGFIEAVKYHRSMTGSLLQDAKTYCEILRLKHHAGTPVATVPTTPATAPVAPPVPEGAR